MKDVSYGQLRRQYAIKITSKGIIGRRSLSKVLSYYRPQRSCEGYVFTGVCLSTRGAGGVCLSVCWDTTPSPGNRHPPLEQTPPRADTPLQSRHPPEQTPPSPAKDGHCCGQYTSYWNAFLFSVVF